MPFCWRRCWDCCCVKVRRDWIFANLLTLGAAIGMLERSYVTLGTEMGFVEGSCSQLTDGFPAWLPLDRWVPAVFEPLESCGLTPWVIPQWMSMAQALILVAGGLVLVMLVMTVVSLIPERAAD
ncbi:MAG: disulfide bond formation protein B [Thiolinea sp.]